MEMDDFTQLVQSVNGLLWGMYCLIPVSYTHLTLPTT